MALPHLIRVPLFFASPVSLLSCLLLVNCSSEPSNPIDQSLGSSGGATGSGGVQGSGSATGTGGVGGAGAGGMAGTGSTSNSGGVTGGGGDIGVASGGGGNDASGGESGEDLDKGGKTSASAGDMTSTPQDYLRLGDIRILNNNWGSEDLGCDTTMSVFVDDNKAFGWNFNRGVCGGKNNPAMPDTSHPDFPQIEFGIHPFGIGSPLATSPDYSSTTLLPVQVKDILASSAGTSIQIDNLTISLQGQESWNISAEFWLSEGNPLTDSSPNVMAELMTWWGWDAGRWPCEPPNDGVQAGSLNYSLCHQREGWGDSSDPWSYYQFRAGDGSDGNSKTNFNGTVDVKALLTYLVGKGLSQDLWVSRLEVGSEIDDNTAGTVKLDGITFEVMGEKRSEVILP
jgi:hypothetical protein